ncbi:zinc finger protein 1 homolog isoform X2 [Ambystoma mexicanum]|uniref:zinc finger protein 1 homolog isoform X2 n=1 Tax=Ambystoma mexicanum TaxID=8296 RepID=UPI0037E7A818
MKTREEPCLRRCQEAPLAFCDVAACFSEEEWKLLQLWQKELYQNVMKEIKQAFSSLGPLIASSVFSLKPKDKGDLCFKDLQDLDMRTSISTSSGALILDHEPAVKKEKELASGLKDLYGAGGESSTDHGPGDHVLDPGNIVQKDKELNLDSNGAERGECSAGTGFVREDDPPVFSFKIKREGASYSIDPLDCERRERISGTKRFPHMEVDEHVRDCADAGREARSIQLDTGNGNQNRKRNVDSASNYDDKKRLCKSTAKRSNTNDVQVHYGSKPPISCQLSHESAPKLSGEQSSPWESGYHQPTHSSLHPPTPYGQRSGASRSRESTLRQDVIPGQLNTTQSIKTYIFPEREQHFQKSSRTVHLRGHNLKGKFTCNECGKSFSAMSNLIIHRRIHTGERPYHCDLCGKSFNQMGAFHRHQQMHTGERPHECTVCGKRFNRKDHLTGHQRKHTQVQQNYEMGLLEIV